MLLAFLILMSALLLGGGAHHTFPKNMPWSIRAGGIIQILLGLWAVWLIFNRC